MGFDDVVPLLGDFGKYQKKVYFLLCLPAISSAFHKLGNVFLLAKPSYRCRIPNEPLDSPYAQNISFMEQWYPYDQKTNSFSSCHTLQNLTQTCSEFIYDESLYGNTAVIEFNLTCGRDYLISTSNSMFMVGVMLGSIIFGQTSDRWGRKTTFLVSSFLQLVFGLLAAFAPEFWTFTIARLIVGASSAGAFLVAYVMGLEMVGPSKRLVAGMVVFIFFSGGYVLTGILAKLFPDWRHFQLALTLPGILFLFYWWLIPESVRWLLLKNKVEDAKKVIRLAAKTNKVNIPEETLDSLLKEGDENKEKDITKMTASVVDLMKHSNLRKRSLIIFFDWVANNITYYGLSWGTNSLGGNPYITFMIAGAVETPANIFVYFTLNRWGRKKVLCGSMLVAGLALLVTTGCPASVAWLTVALAMLGKLAITVSYVSIYIFSAEQFPTVVRNAGMGASSTFARLGSIVAPYIIDMPSFWPGLPLVIFGSLTLIGGMLSLLLPETLNKKLPQTIAEGEAFGKKIKKPLEVIRIEAPKEPNEIDTGNVSATLLDNSKDITPNGTESRS